MLIAYGREREKKGKKYTKPMSIRVQAPTNTHKQTTHLAIVIFNLVTHSFFRSYKKFKPKKPPPETNNNTIDTSNNIKITK